jgi:hypothetical protein
MTSNECKHHFEVPFDQTGKTVIKNCSNCGITYDKASMDILSEFYKNQPDEDSETSLPIPHHHVWNQNGMCIYRLNSTTAKDGTMKGWKYTAPEKPGYGARYDEIPAERICHARRCI